MDKGTVPPNISIQVHPDKRLDRKHARRLNQPTTTNTSDTFKKACQQLNLLGDGYEWRNCIAEATEVQKPLSFRALIVLQTYRTSSAWYRIPQWFNARRFIFVARSKVSLTQPWSLQVKMTYCVISMTDFDSRTEQLLIFGLSPSNRKQKTCFLLGLTQMQVCISIKVHSYWTVTNIMKTKVDRKEGGLIFIDAPDGAGKTFYLLLY